MLHTSPYMREGRQRGDKGWRGGEEGPSRWVLVTERLTWNTVTQRWHLANQSSLKVSKDCIASAMHHFPDVHHPLRSRRVGWSRWHPHSSQLPSPACTGSSLSCSSTLPLLLEHGAPAICNRLGSFGVNSGLDLSSSVKSELALRGACVRGMEELQAVQGALSLLRW